MRIYAVCHAMVDLWHVGHVVAGILVVFVTTYLCDRALFGSSSAASDMGDSVDRFHGHYWNENWYAENYGNDNYDGYYGG